MNQNRKKTLNKAARRAIRREARKDFNFLNGNTVSLFGNKKRGGLKSRKSVVERDVPVAKGFRISTTPASIVTSLNKTKIKHREYVMDIDGTADFEGTSMVINPGNGMLFPWLSQIAQRYQSYLFNNLQFHYVTTSPTGTAGSVILTADYDSNSTLPATKTQALSMESSVRVQPWDCVTHVSKMHNLRKRSSYYVRNGTDDVVDSELYDVGAFMIMTEGLNSEFVDGTVGELHVEYDVDLITPVLTNATSSVTGVAGAYEGGYIVGGGTSAASRPYLQFAAVFPADLPVRDGGETLAVANGGAAAGNFTVRVIDIMQPGVYLMITETNFTCNANIVSKPEAGTYGYFSTNGSAELIWYALDDTDPQSLVQVSVFAVRFDGPGTSGQPFGSFGFGWNQTIDINTRADTFITLSPWSASIEGFEPGPPTTRANMWRRTGTLKQHIGKRSNGLKPRFKTVSDGDKGASQAPANATILEAVQKLLAGLSVDNTKPVIAHC